MNWRGYSWCSGGETFRDVEGHVWCSGGDTFREWRGYIWCSEGGTFHEVEGACLLSLQLEGGAADLRMRALAAL